MKTPQWIKKLGGHAGELFVAAELSKRGIPNVLLPENFSDDDILIADKPGNSLGYVQVKACHPTRSESFILEDSAEEWKTASDNHYVVFVWLGDPEKNEPPRFWIAKKSDVGEACVKHAAHGTNNWERRFYPEDLNPKWENNWKIFGKYVPTIREYLKVNEKGSKKR